MRAIERLGMESLQQMCSEKPKVRLGRTLTGPVEDGPFPLQLGQRTQGNPKESSTTERQERLE